jgi:predicted nucleic acid-binding protein
MAHDRRDQRHLAIDSNVLVAYLDKEHPQHSKVTTLSSSRVAFNPTVVHESYHTLVFKMKWEPVDASGALMEVLDDSKILFLNQTRDTTRIGLRLAERYALGGRDALILASFLNPSISEFKTFDKELTRLRRVEYGSRRLIIRAA